jgi:selenoprotein W-related protein
LLKNFEPEIETLSLVPSDGGVFEVTVNDKLLYSKKQLERHAQPGEVVELVKDFLQESIQ